MALTVKQELFVSEYLKHFNATKAALDAGYSPKTAYSIGWQNLRKVEIAEVVSQRLAESAMSADEVLMRLAQHGRADMGQWMSDDGELDIAAMKRDGATHLLHKVKRTERSGVSPSGTEWSNVTVEVELQPAQPALTLIGKHHKLFTDSVEHSGSVDLTINKGYIGINPDEWDENKGSTDSSL